MAPDDEDSEDLYDDEFDFVDDDDDDASDLDDEDDDDSELDSPVEDIAAEDNATRDDADSELDQKSAPRETAAKRVQRNAFDDGPEPADRDGERDVEVDGLEEPVDDYARPEAAANYRVHIYEYREFKRTIDRPFTAEDAESFASEYNRTSKSYGRFAVTGKDDAKPRKLLD